MRDTQPPITDDEELQGYQMALTVMNKELMLREAAVFNSHSEPQRLERARNALFRLYRKRQGIIDAIEVYEKRQKAKQSA
jgi:hypothetical protein